MYSYIFSEKTPFEKEMCGLVRSNCYGKANLLGMKCCCPWAGPGWTGRGEGWEKAKEEVRKMRPGGILSGIQVWERWESECGGHRDTRTGTEGFIILLQCSSNVGS